MALCIEAPVGSRVLLEMPQTLLAVLGLRPVDPELIFGVAGGRGGGGGGGGGGEGGEGDGGGEGGEGGGWGDLMELRGVSGARASRMDALQLMATPIELRKVIYRSSGGAAPCMGDGGGAGTVLEAKLGSAGRCAELVLSASGPSHDAVLAAAVGAMRAGAEPRAELWVQRQTEHEADL